MTDNKPYFSTSTKKHYASLKEAIEESVAFNTKNGINTSEIIALLDGMTIHGTLQKVAEGEAAQELVDGLKASGETVEDIYASDFGDDITHNPNSGKFGSN